MKLLHIREFSHESEFMNPCTSYLLSDVICTWCNYPCDMDLLRDPDLLNENWNCKYCGHVYSKPAIEARLVDVVLKKSLCFQLQDLMCEKCKQIKAENMSEICGHCSGKFICKESPSEFRKRYLPPLFSSICSLYLSL